MWDDDGMELVSMTKRELATLYAPELEPHAAVNRLTRWIACNPSLALALRSAGYRKTQRLLSPRQVGLIVEHLGEP